MNIVRPINWNRLRTIEAENIVRKLADENNSGILFSKHAFDRQDERAISLNEVLFILREGFAEEDPVLNSRGEWECTFIKKLRGERKAGVVTAIVSQEKIKVITVLWRDI